MEIRHAVLRPTLPYGRARIGAACGVGGARIGRARWSGIVIPLLKTSGTLAFPTEDHVEIPAAYRGVCASLVRSDGRRIDARSSHRFFRLAVAESKVTLVNTATGVRSSRTSATDGYATFTPIPASVYSVEVAKPGFNRHA